MKILRKHLFGKLNPSLFRALESATAYAKLKGHGHVALAHWLWHFWQLPGTDLQLLAMRQQVDTGVIDDELRQASERQPLDSRGLVDFGPQVLAALEKAWLQASLVHGDSRIRSAWLLEALLSHPELQSALKVASPRLHLLGAPLQGDQWDAVLAQSTEQAERPHDGTDLTPSTPGEASGALSAEGHTKSALAKYCSNLTTQARTGQIDPVIGRERDIQGLIDILLRRRQNNPLLTGEAGVGKTAVVEGLALAIAQNKVPPALRDVQLLTLDVGALIAGASMRGEFEARLKQLLEEVKGYPQPIVLFIDEIHTLVGAGGQAGTGDAANLLKPALARGGLRMIGATTWTEFKQHIEKDPALTRRFQVLQVEQPEPEEAKSMLRALVSGFARHHGVFIADAAVEAAVDLSHRYIPARQLPDKAIGLLDTACARVAMSLHAEPAPLLMARARLDAVRTARELCEAERARTPEVAARLERLIAEESEQAQVLERQETQWHREREHAAELLQAWQHHAQGGKPSSAPDATDLGRRLRSLQDGRPLVHTEVSAEVVAAVVQDWTGIPAGRMLSDDRLAALGLTGTLERRIKGQHHALEAIARKVQIAKSGLGDPGRPVGVFLLSGPSGVGKTETALALAEAVYGGEHHLITLNMSEFQEPHSVASLKGAPPGYVGYGQGGVLTEAVRRRPYSVVLLDEIEKAHPDVHEVFYQVFDKGWMEDGQGLKIDFRHTLILMTSNCGAELIEQLCGDEAVSPAPEGLASALNPELRRTFPAAFLGRVIVVPYLPLSTQAIDQVVDLQLSRVVQRMLEQHDIELQISHEARSHVTRATGGPEIGARRIAQHIDRQILPLLATHWLESPPPDGARTCLHLHWDDTAGYRLLPSAPPSTYLTPSTKPSMG